jgi:GTP cyclohydrolase II
LKVVLDSTLRLPSTAALLRESPARTVLLTTSAASERDISRVTVSGATVLVAASDEDGWVDLADGLRRLRAIGVRSLLVEGGARVITSLLRRQLVDRLAVCGAPIILGSGVEAIGDLGIVELTRSLGLRAFDVRRLGQDLIISGEVMPERQEATVSVGRPPTLAASSRLPTRHGPFELRVYELAGAEYPILLRGSLAGEPPLVRLHSECLTGEVFGSRRCDCGEQLEGALASIEAEGSGVLLYLAQEGRGIGLLNKLRAYELQEQGLDTVEANIELGFKADPREYGIGSQILVDLGVTTMRLMTNNPAKYGGLEGYGLEIVERVPLHVTPNHENISYLRAKQEKLGHLLDLGEAQV